MFSSFRMRLSVTTATIALVALLAAEHARRMADRLEHQEASVRRFLELSGEDAPETT